MRFFDRFAAVRGSTPRLIAVACTSAAVGILAAGCGGKGNATDEIVRAEPLPACESFLAAYRGCLSKLGPGIAEERIASLRATLDSPTRDEAALRTKCTDSLARLRVACP
jgi:hypothetical protein